MRIMRIVNSYTMHTVDKAAICSDIIYFIVDMKGIEKMKHYSEEKLQALNTNIQTIDVNGVPVILKTSPSEPRPGRMDKDLVAKESARGSFDFSIIEKLPPDQLLQFIRDGMGGYNVNICTEEVHAKFETLDLGGNPVGLWRYYTRKSQNRPNKPALVYFHGGGWIGGSVYTLENACRFIAQLADAVVFNVDYSLAPEKPFPNGLSDNYLAVKHVYDHAGDYGIDPKRIAVGGDSAGGNYAAAVSIKARDLGTPPIALQILLYPAVALADACPAGYAWSHDMFEIDEEERDLIMAHLTLGEPAAPGNNPMVNSYLQGADYHQPYISPMLADSHANLPPALLLAGEFDGLRIQTEFYAKQLQDAGVPVRCIRYKGMAHAFIDDLGILCQAEDFCREAAAAILKID